LTYILTNFLPIAAATLAGLLFGFAWLRLLGPEAADRFTAPSAAVAVVAEFWLAAILAGALILAPPQAGEWVMATMTPVVIWIGFVVPALAVTLSYRGFGARTAFIDCGLWLGTMVLQALVLKLVGLIPPAPPPA
jgi:hypothetical protein